jgi:hypothetical protein
VAVVTHTYREVYKKEQTRKVNSSTQYVVGKYVTDKSGKRELFILDETKENSTWIKP